MYFFRSGPRLTFLASRLKNSKANGQTILGRDAMALVNLMKLHFASNVASNDSFCMEPYGTLHRLHGRKGKQWKTWKSWKLGCNSGPRHRLWTWRIFTLPKRSWSVRSPFWCDAAVTVVLLNCFSLLHQLHPSADEARTTQRMRRTITICWRAYTDVRCVPFPDVPFQMCLDSYRWKSYLKKNWALIANKLLDRLETSSDHLEIKGQTIFKGGFSSSTGARHVAAED